MASTAFCAVFIGIITAAPASAASSSASSAAQDQCALAVTREYHETTVKIYEAARQKSVFPTIQEVIDKRRAQESYCLKFAGCLRRAGVDDAQAAVEGALAFTNCIEDEEKEEVISRLQDADAKEKEEVISRLRDE